MWKQNNKIGSKDEFSFDCGNVHVNSCAVLLLLFSLNIDQGPTLDLQELDVSFVSDGQRLMIEYIWYRYEYHSIWNLNVI